MERHPLTRRESEKGQPKPQITWINSAWKLNWTNPNLGLLQWLAAIDHIYAIKFSLGLNKSDNCTVVHQEYNNQELISEWL